MDDLFWQVSERELATDLHELLDDLTRAMRNDVARLNALIPTLDPGLDWIASWKRSGTRFDAGHDGARIILRTQGVFGRPVEYPIDPMALTGLSMPYRDVLPILFNKVITAWMHHNVP